MSNNEPISVRNGIEEMLRALEIEFGVMLTVHDVGGIFHDAEGTPLLPPPWQTHRRNPLCLRIDRDRCIRHCLDRVNAQCRVAGDQAIVIPCWAGLVEVCVSLRRGGLHVGTLSAGAWRAAGLGKRVPACFSGSRALADTCANLQVLDPERARRLSCVLVACADGLVAALERLQRLDTSPGDRRGDIARFVATHADRPVSTGDLARMLNLSPSRAGHVVKALFGAPLAALLRRERLSRACTLLRTTDFPVKEIARRSGFSDPFRFSRVFRAAEGTSPGRYRRRFQPRGVFH